jgi:microcin C transport system substrate-binding protein
MFDLTELCVKNLLAVFCLFSMSYGAFGQEVRKTALHPSGKTIEWGPKSEFAEPLKDLPVKGSLTLTRTMPIESVHPYDLDGGRAVRRPEIIDDLYYEPLFLRDPVGRTETLYPLIAQAVRFAPDMSYAVFEIDPRARFQDGTYVNGFDLLYSWDVLKQSSPFAKSRLDEMIKSTSAGTSEVRVDFVKPGEAAMNAVLLLASAKIVKPNTTGATEVGGLRVKYTVTGPYRLTQLGRARLSLITDPSYWARSSGVRRGFFNFRIVEVVAYPDESAARMSMAGDTANFFHESQPGTARITQELLKNGGIAHTEEPATINGERIPSLSFNIRSAAVADWRVRAAVLLAYDFEQINQLQYAGVLRRPLSLLDGSALAPKGEPSASVKALMDTCAAPELGAFESHGHAQYAALSDKRVRLLTAMRLLQEAGLKLENGILKRPLPDGTYVSEQLRLLVKDTELRAAYLFRADLQRLGISVEIESGAGEHFRVMQASGQYELVSAQEGFLDKEGWPSPGRLRLGEAKDLPCLENMARTLETEPPSSQAFRDTSEAIARVHEALSLSIFTGAPEKKHFFYNGSLDVPPRLSVENMHMYGYWTEPAPAMPVSDPPFPMPAFSPSGCMDFSCIFGHGR